MCKDKFNIFSGDRHTHAFIHALVVQSLIVSISKRLSFHARTSLVQAASAL